MAASAASAPYGGRCRTISDRSRFAAIVFMAAPPPRGGLLPARELGCGSPATCWRRFTEWAKAGVFDQLHLEVLDRLGEQGRLDQMGANPVDRGKPGAKLHLVCEGGGLPLTPDWLLTSQEDRNAVFATPDG
jgi:transposase